MRLCVYVRVSIENVSVETENLVVFVLLVTAMSVQVDLWREGWAGEGLKFFNFLLATLTF